MDYLMDCVFGGKEYSRETSVKGTKVDENHYAVTKEMIRGGRVIPNLCFYYTDA